MQTLAEAIEDARHKAQRNQQGAVVVRLPRVNESARALDLAPGRDYVACDFDDYVELERQGAELVDVAGA